MDQKHRPRAADGKFKAASERVHISNNPAGDLQEDSLRSPSVHGTHVSRIRREYACGGVRPAPSALPVIIFACVCSASKLILCACALETTEDECGGFHRVENGRVEDLVRWEHWSAGDDTWEATDGLGDGPAMSEWREAHGAGLRAGRGGVVRSARPRRPCKPGAFPFPRETPARSGRAHASAASHGAHGRGRHGCRAAGSSRPKIGEWCMGKVQTGVGRASTSSQKVPGEVLV